MIDRRADLVVTKSLPSEEGAVLPTRTVVTMTGKSVIVPGGTYVLQRLPPTSVRARKKKSLVFLSAAWEAQCHCPTGRALFSFSSLSPSSEA
jgi:hypothetical protein